MIVVPTGSSGIEISRFLRLTGTDEADVVDLGAVGMLGMGIGRHLVLPIVVVDEQDARPLTHTNRDWADAG